MLITAILSETFIFISSYLFMNSLWHMAPKIIWHYTELNFISGHLLGSDVTFVQVIFQYLQVYVIFFSENKVKELLKSAFL